MNVSFGRCEEILKTLPIGFYLGHKVTVTLDSKSNDTYINMYDEKITISYKCIVNMCKNAKDNCNTEEIIRGLLYHEISHALLSMVPDSTFSLSLPKKKDATSTQKDFLMQHWHDFYNIFEDERIETILSNYYYGVNFKKNLVLLNNIDPKKELTTKNPIKKFYIAVRYHMASKGILTKISKLLNTYWYLDSAHRVKDHSEYVTAILGLAYEFLDDITPPSQNEGSSEDQSENKSDEPATQDDSNEDDTDDSDNTDEPDDTSEQNSSASIDNTTGDVNDQVLEQIANAIPNVFQKPEAICSDNIKSWFKRASTNREAEAMSTRIEKIIRIATAKHNSQASGSSAYAGRIDPHLCRNEDYKWWMKKTDTGSNKRFTKIHFNLFCDNSGSFEDSKNQMNGLILALRKLEEKNKDFSVTIVHCGWGMRIPDQDNPYLTCGEGSLLPATATGLYNSLQKPNTTNINLVVFDGDMSGEDTAFYWRRYYNIDPSQNQKNFKAFNHKNCIVVSDVDNQTYFEQYAPNARCTFIEKNYANIFIETVMSQLERALV